MFQSVQTRFVLRCVLVGLAAVAASLQGNLPGVSVDELIQAVLGGYLAASAYAGIGALIPAVEPNIGLKQKDE